MLKVDLSFRRSDFTLQLCTEFSVSVTGVFGPSGCGKSTLLALIAGLLNPQRGTIILNDRELVNTSTGLTTAPHLRHIGLVFQDGQLFPHLTVAQNLRYGWQHLKAHQRHFEFDYIVDLLELKSLVNRLPQELSGGEKQRVALGRAILYSPELLLLDEPLSALDSRLKEQILGFLARIKNELEIPMIYVSHDMAEIKRLTECCLVMESGRLAS